MNADVYADTAQGVVGTNMFAYCNNNPVMFVDPYGTDPISNLFNAFKKILNTLTAFYKTIIGNGGNSINSSMQIKMETSTIASISKSNEIDWFKFKTTYAGAYNIFTEGDVDTKIELCTKTIFGKAKVLFSNDKIREYAEIAVDITVAAVLEIITYSYPSLNAYPISTFIANFLISAIIPNHTALELNQIATAGNLTSDGRMQNGIVIISISNIEENYLGEKVKEYSTHYSGWEGDEIYGERYYRGKFDVNDKVPV